MVRVAVYGSLKEGYAFNYMLSDGIRLGYGIVKGTLYDLGSYPALDLDGNNKVHVQIYDVDETILDRLDILERVPYLYKRKEINIDGHGGCWIYYMPLLKILSFYKVIEDDDGIQDW